jgi:uncharacterized phage protein (TIGR01671 family)
MREIKFRGKRLDGIWIYGDLRHQPYAKGSVTIISFMEDTGGFWVIPETVGQYTGLKDKNGKEIYEGDITQDVDTGKTFEIMYQGHMFMRYERKPMYMFYTLDGDCLEVIGNIYENPELMT